MSLKFKCLILDHDDTAVDSTATIHYPAHLEVMNQIRPERVPIGLNGWFLKNFHPGIMQYLTEEIGFNDRELELEYRIWRDFTSSRVPEFFEGFLEALLKYRQAGGRIAVVSHSEKDIIVKHYRALPLGERCLPNLVYGWDYDENKRKPSPWPVREILQGFQLKCEDALIVDDLKPGVLMSRAAGVPIAAAGWSHRILEREDYMRNNCAAYLATVGEFESYILSA